MKNQTDRIIARMLRGWSCHQGPQGIHGDRSMWRIYKANELQILNDTLETLYG